MLLQFPSFEICTHQWSKTWMPLAMPASFRAVSPEMKKKKRNPSENKVPKISTPKGKACDGIIFVEMPIFRPPMDHRKTSPKPKRITHPVQGSKTGGESVDRNY